VSAGIGPRPITPARARSLTLTWVNRVRSSHRLGDPLEDLPTGWGGSCGCPVAAALTDLEAGRIAEVGLQHARIHATAPNAATDVRLQLPAAAQAFIGWFDERVYPDLLRAR
jgi:hypothetical protein